MSTFVPSKYQKDIFSFIKNSKDNAVVSAVAGSGKTTTLIKALEKIPNDKTVLFMAFNKSIADEIKKRVPQTNNIVVKTVHGFGYSILKQYFDFEIDNKKYNKLLKDITSYLLTGMKGSIEKYEFNPECMGFILKMIGVVSKDENFDAKEFFDSVITLSNLGRLHFIDTKNYENGIKKLDSLARIHSIGNEDGESHVSWYLIKVANHYTKVIDFTDMVYLPNELNHVETEKYDFVFIDECQDLNTCQRMLMEKAMKPDVGRFIAVGDEKQAIYGFAGADVESFKKLCNLPNTKQLPLSYTYRCGSEIVKKVKHISSIIKSHKKNGLGMVFDDYSYKNIQDGDMVLCRQTFPIVSLCIRFLTEGKKAYIIGSDIGISLVKMITECQRITEEFNMKNVFSRLYNEKEKLIEKIMSNHNITKADALEDSYVIMFNEKIQVIEALSKGTEDPNVVITKINEIFSDKHKVGICLSNIHKSKGLESDRVFILHSELMPSKYAKLPWQIEQEQNLIYVAYTRAKTTLGFINDYDAWATHESQSKNVTEVFESKYVGSVGMSMKLELEVIGIRVINGPYGETKVYEMKDSKNNIFTKFGDISSRFLVNKIHKQVDVGTKVSFYGIINGHNEFKGIRTTKLGKITQY